MNPGSKRFMDTVYSYRVLSVEDEGSTGYIERYAGWTDPYKIAANPAAAQAVSTDAVPAAGTAGTDGNDDPIRRMVVSAAKARSLPRPSVCWQTTTPWTSSTITLSPPSTRLASL